MRKFPIKRILSLNRLTFELYETFKKAISYLKQNLQINKTLIPNLTRALHGKEITICQTNIQTNIQNHTQIILANEIQQYVNRIIHHN